MRARRAHHATIDTDAFTRAGEHIEGVLPASDCERMRELLADDQGQISWSLRGGRRSRPEGGADGYLELTLGGAVRLPCVRCLDAVDVPLHETRHYRLALTEAQAERDDVDSEEFDVITGGRHFDVLELVEDEAIMALPFAPSHEACALPVEPPQADRASDPPEDAVPERPNPFAVLERLKRGPGRSEG